MRLLIAFFVLSNFAWAVGVTRQRNTPLVPSFSLASLGSRVASLTTDDPCGITCLPASPSGAVCTPLSTDPSAYPCDSCPPSDNFGCCAVDGYYPTLCTAAFPSDDCLASADQMSRSRSEVCTTEVTCQPSCGVQDMTITDQNGNQIVLCSYDTCAGEQSCPPPPPPPVCVMGPWSGWSICQLGDGTPVDCVRTSGIQIQTRTPVDASACFDAIQNPTMQTRACAKPVMECLVNCAQSAYSVSQACPKCWNRTLTNTPPLAYNYSIVSTWGRVPGALCDCPIQGAAPNTNLCSKQVVCDTIPICPRNCVASAWSAWGACDKSCADYQNGTCQTCTGIQYRTRTIVTTAQYGGINCGALSASKSCNTQQCPIPCLMSTWSVWSACTAQCGGGQTLRTRYTIVSAQFAGTPCGDSLQTNACGTAPCPIGCVVGGWNGWDRTCPDCVSDNLDNPGSRTRSRQITVPPQFNGSSCPPTSETIACPYNYCPVPCQWGPWSTWTACPVSCGGAVQQRFREVQTTARFGGQDCVGPTSDTQPCNVNCCPVDCVWYYSIWKNPNNASQDCSVRCGGGTQIRSVVVVTPAACGGKTCGSGKDSDLVQPCNTPPCSVNCQVSDYDKTVSDCLHNKDYCSETCGLGWCVRKRSITTYPQFGGSMCPLLEDWIACNNGPCTQPCKYSDWGSWSNCPATCANGDATRTRARVLLNPDHVDAGTCNDLTQTHGCDSNPCPVDCFVATWSQWSPCQVSCGLGTRMRTRATTAPLYGGAICPYSIDINYCDKGPCPVTCVVSDWEEWTPCPVTCTDGPNKFYRSRHREILLNGTNGCDLELEDSEPFPCGSGACPKNCLLTDWTDWSACTGCGLQQQSRTRNVTQQPSAGGRICQVTNDYRLCQGTPCNVPCTFSPWSDWGPCTKSCGEGARKRNRYLMDETTDETACPALNQAQPCFEATCCPVDCKFIYSDWTPCSPQGYRRRFVTITQDSLCGGAPCPVCRVERDDCTPPEQDKECWLEDCPDS